MLGGHRASLGFITPRSRRLLLIAAGLLATWSVLPGMANRSAAGQPVVLRDVSMPAGPVAIRHAQETLDRGDLVIADDHLRVAWLDPDTRERAAAMLWDLHRTPGFSIRAEDRAVDETMRGLGPKFRKIETPHFVLISDAPGPWVEERGRLLERTREQFYRVAAKLGCHPIPHRFRLMVVLFNDVQGFRAFARERDGVAAEWVAGYYASRSNRVVLFNHASAPDFVAARQRLDATESRISTARRDAQQQRNQRLATDLIETTTREQRLVERARADLDRQLRTISDTKAIHEAIHLLSFNAGVQRLDREYPFWFSEGLAMSFEPRDPSVAFGPDRPESLAKERIERYDEQVADKQAMPAQQLVSLAEVPDWEENAADSMYSASAALFLQLYRRDPLAIGRYLRAIEQHGPTRISPERHAAIFTEHFGSAVRLGQTMQRAAMARTRARATSPETVAAETRPAP